MVISKIIRTMVVLLALCWAYGTALAVESIAYAELGDLRLENGQVLYDCRIGFRAFGKINPERSNVVLFPTWFCGTSADIAALGFIGAGKLADTEKFHVIAIDNIGNGVSSSPSNSVKQPREAFPECSLRDMVKAQHQFMRENLGLDRVYAIVGISMGAMQVFQWLAEYPDCMQKGVAISGTPQLTSYDRLLWQAELQAIQMAKACQDGRMPAMKTVAPFHTLLSRTPHYFETHVPRDDFDKMLAFSEQALQVYDPNNWICQIKAMQTHDIYRAFDGSEERAAQLVKARLLVIAAGQDFMVDPEPSLAFAKRIKAETYRLPGDCGHLSFTCEPAALQTAVAAFLSR